MALLENLTGSAPVSLRAHHRVGRAPDCDLVLAGAEVSGAHALLRWTGVHWELRDLGSRNGTWVDGRRMGPGESVPLPEGAGMAFGGAAHRWRLVDASPPRIQAVPLDGGEAVSLLDQFIALPDADAPLLTVYRNAAGAWVADQDGTVVVVADLATVEVGGRAYRLDLAGGVSGTVEAVEMRPEVAKLAVEFTVSQDEEHIELMMRAGGLRSELGSRSHHQLLLTLARARLEDRAEGCSAAEEGWVYQDDLLKMLATSFNKLQVHIFRARRQFGESGVLDAAEVIQRRPDTGQIRLGVPEILIRR